MLVEERWCTICCFHWTSRWLHLPITVLPMQCLLYFVLGVNSVESKQCDTRVLKRLATTISEEQNNVWRTIFQTQELEAPYRRSGHFSNLNPKKQNCG